MSKVIPIGSDHAGCQMKERLEAGLARLGYDPLVTGFAGGRHARRVARIDEETG